MPRALTKERVLLLSSLALGVAALAALGCGGGAPTPATQTATAQVTPEAGGKVTLPDNSVKLEVPPGAVPANTMITMTTTDATAPQGLTADSPILQFQPDGIVFTKPVTVTFTFKNATNPVVYWSNASGGYDLIMGTVTGSTIAAPVMHFSKGFVGEQPAGASDKCGAGVACAAAASCGYGGVGPTSGGSVGAPTDGGTSTGDKTGGGSVAAADASAPMSGGSSAPGPAAPKTSALGASGDAGGASAAGTGMCCTCGSDGVFHCSTCQATNGGTDAGAPVCAEGATCAPGAGCGGVGAPGGGGGLCCMCGADGVFHCGAASCGNPPTGDRDASTGTGGGIDGSAGGDRGLCVQGAACQPGSAGCGNASPTSCSMCMCGADGTLACQPCKGGQPPGDGGQIPPTGQCVQGGACTPGSADCGDPAANTCVRCSCTAQGTLACSPCPGSDGGVTKPPVYDGGAPPPPPQCAQGMACSGGGCGNGQAGAACTMCVCTNGAYQCGPCGGAIDAAAPPPPTQDGAAPFQCISNGPCPQVGGMCTIGGPGNGFQCACGASMTLQCKSWPPAP